MQYEIKYINNKMVFPEFHCNCGYSHDRPDIDIYIGSGILKDCAQYVADGKLGNNAVLVADNITYEVAGRFVEEQLMARGFRITLCLLEREDELEPDETALGEVLLSMDKDTEFFISVGSGSITDTTRYVAFNTGRPFVSIGTAPSMDGYTSVVAPLLFNGMKVNKKADCPRVIICDTDIMRKAPVSMFLSGTGDVLGKYIAKADWVLGSFVKNELYCPVCGDMVMQAVQKCVDNAEEIRNRSEEGTKILIEALILAGVTIMIIGNTRAVASVEHNMAHYWEMMKLAAGEKAPSHGTAVGVGTIYSLKFFQQLLSADPACIDKRKIRAAAQSGPDREKHMVDCYGPKIAKAIMKENPEDFLDWSEHEKRIDAIVSNWGQIMDEIRELPSLDKMVDIYRKLGAPVSASDIGVDAELLKKTLKCSKDYRSRYNVCKTLDEIGLLDEAVSKICEAQ